MKDKLKITYYKPDKQGVTCLADGYSFATEADHNKKCGVLLYANDGSEVRIPFSENGKQGTLYGVRIEGDGEFPFVKYNYYADREVITDAYATLVDGLQDFGEHEDNKRRTYGVLKQDVYDWEDDEALVHPINETIIYGINVRMFTMHPSSGVKNKGCFEGIVEKIPYLKELGITAVELMPAYEYDECMSNNRVNCWGFQEGFYFAPKASYSKNRADISFKNMVKELHKNDIEVMMQFYFPPTCKPSYIVDVLKYWVIEYHIDGMRLSGFNIPLSLIAGEPVLKRTKIRCTYFPLEEIYADKPPVYRNLLSDNGDFKNEMRRYLKGDDNLINQLIQYQSNNPDMCGVVNSIADYDGFSLYDTVSYERKHNETNGEDNRDGTNYNYSWNCGVEGESRKKTVLELRKKQIKNAFSFLLLSQGVPYIFSGDEFANTRNGNNNCYCQDNETGYIKWKMNQFSKDIFAFVRELIRLRKHYGILHAREKLQSIDVSGCGYPEISYHGIEAWRPDCSYSSRTTGIMLCDSKELEEAEFLYIAYNMHWEKHELALPKLPKGKVWSLLMCTADTDSFLETSVITKQNIVVQERSVSLYCAKADESLYDKKSTKKKSMKA